MTPPPLAIVIGYMACPTTWLGTKKPIVRGACCVGHPSMAVILGMMGLTKTRATRKMVLLVFCGLGRKQVFAWPGLG